jgi:hypothetical protein
MSIGGIRGSNPNAQTMRPYGGMTPNPNQGIATIQERLAGLNTLQTNVPGTPTNTAPALATPPRQQQYEYGYGFNPDQYGQQYQYSPVIDYAYQHGGQAGGLSLQDWIQQLAASGQVTQVPGRGWTTSGNFHEAQLGAIRDRNGMLHNTFTNPRYAGMDESQRAALTMGLKGDSRYQGASGKQYVSGWGPSTSNTQMTPRYGYGGASGFTAGVPTVKAPGGGNVQPLNPAAPAAPAGMPSYNQNATPPYQGVSPVGRRN